MSERFDIDALLRVRIAPTRRALDPKECILYALAVDVVEQAEDAWSLPFVYEHGLRVLPTMATVIGRPDGWMTWPELGPLARRMLHGAQRLEVHRPLEPGAAVVARHRIAEVVDKGPERGALLVVERALFDDAGASLATLYWTVHCAGAGGFGGGNVRQTPQSPPVPDRPADQVMVKPTRPDAALLFRLTGDVNPIHADPAAARGAGLERPLLHGLQLFGSVVVQALRSAGCDPGQLALADMRFSGPVYPGEQIEISLWDNPGGYAVRVCCPERDAVVVDRGLIEVR